MLPVPWIFGSCAVYTGLPHHLPGHLITPLFLIPATCPTRSPPEPLHPIIQLPESRRPRRSMRIVILVEPVPQYTPCTFQSSDLHTLGAPSLFAVEDAECCPTDDEVVFRGCVGDWWWRGLLVIVVKVGIDV